MTTTTKTTADTVDLADFIREHTQDWLKPWVDELERRYYMEFARSCLARAELAHKAAEANELRRQA